MTTTHPRGTILRRPASASAPLVAALAFVLPFLAGLAGGGAIGDRTYPSPFATNAEILHYFAHNHDAVVLQSLLQCVAAVGLLVLAAELAAAASRTDDRAVLTRLIAASGGFSAAFQLLSALLGWVGVRSATQASPALVRALHDLSFLTGGPGTVLGVGLMIGSVALALPTVIPTWTRAVGLVLPVVAVLSLLCLVADQAAFLLPVARFLGMAWLLLVTALLSRTQRGAGREGGGR